MINAHQPKAVREREGYYDEFVEKFKPKLTTDDCITPEPVYAAILAWVRKEYKISEKTQIVRPFWPDADYTKTDYSGDSIVVDNPPFSKLAQICRYYNEQGVRYFLFAPTLTLFNGGNINFIVAAARITYENGATIPTSFVTNLGKYKIKIAPELDEAIENAIQIVKEQAGSTKVLPKYMYSENVCTAAKLQKIARQGIPLQISAADTYFIKALDAQRSKGKTVFGAGFLLSNKAAAEKAAAEKAAAEKAAAEKAAAEKAAAEKAVKWELSPRELEIIAGLGEQSAKNKEAERP